jgi:hypothetical protein
MTADQLAQLPLKDLRALAAGRGVANSAKLRKDELVAALAQAMTAVRHEPPAPSAAPAGSSTPPQSGQAWQPAPTQYGLPVPDSYGRDRVVLLVQDPSHVFAYWEVTPATLDRVRAEAGHNAAAVLVLHGPGGAEQREVDLAGGNYYLAVAPGSTYTAELCLRAQDGRLIRIAASGRIDTPAAGPSWRTDEVWMEVDENFQDLLALAGVPGSIGSSMGSGSGERFRNTRQIRVRPVGLESESLAGAAIDVPAGGAVGSPSSLNVAQRGIETWSSASLSSASLVHGAGGGGVTLGSGSGSGLGLLGGSSGQLLSSHALSSRSLSSRALSSRSLSSGAVVDSAAEIQYPVDGVFHAPPTGLPKAAEGVPSTQASLPAPAAPQSHVGQAPQQPPTGPPAAPNAAAPAPASDPLAFIGAPKPLALRKPKPKRA